MYAVCMAQCAQLHLFFLQRGVCALHARAEPAAARKEANRTCTNHHQGESHCSSTLAFSHAPHSRNSPGSICVAHLHARRPHYNTPSNICIKSPPRAHKKSQRAKRKHNLSLIFYSTIVIAHRSEHFFPALIRFLRPRVLCRSPN